MTAPNPANLLRVPGRLSHSPSSLGTYPHGGTALGLASVTFRPRESVFVQTAVEWGGIPVELIDQGPAWTLDAMMREWDADSLAALFPCYAAGRSGGPILKYTADSTVHRAGRKVGTTLGKVVVFTPDSPAEHPWLILRRAVPAIQETAEMAMRANTTVTLPVRWYATPDGNRDVFDWGQLRDLTL